MKTGWGTILLLLTLLFSATVSGAEQESPENRSDVAADTFESLAKTPLPTGPLLTAKSPNGIVTLNVSTGAVNFCVGLAYASGTPYGQCKKLGSISTTNLSGNAHIEVVNYHGFVVNTATGVVLSCSLLSYSSGAPIGNCISLQLQP